MQYICLEQKQFIFQKKTPEDGEEYIDYLISLCHSHNIKILLPGSTWEAKILSKFSTKLNNAQIIPLVNNLSVITLGDDKWETYKQLTDLKIHTPQSFLNIEAALKNEATKFPIVIKPRQGRGSQNIFIANNKEELHNICSYFDLKKLKYLIQEFVGNKNSEYTVGVISNKDGVVIQSIVMRRLLMGGATGYAEVCERNFINDFCEAVARKISSTGPINIQLRLDENNKPLVFEINPRFSGSAPMRMLAGFNEPKLIIDNFYFNEPIKTQKIEYGNRYYRAFQEVEVAKNTDFGTIKNLM
jgi:carbamoyl-phosphate synthase large subunit